MRARFPDLQVDRPAAGMAHSPDAPQDLKGPHSINTEET
jgi:hypothetical protein